MIKFFNDLFFYILKVYYLMILNFLDLNNFINKKYFNWDNIN